MMRRGAAARGPNGGSDAGRPAMPKVVNAFSLRPPGKLQLFEETVLPHMNAAYNVARWLVRDDQDAQDLVQESYLRAFRFFDSYRGGDAKAWLLTIVRNTCATWRRREGATAAVPFDEAAHSPGSAQPTIEQTLVEGTKAQSLRSCIEALPAAYREVLVMRELEEMSYRQISEVSGIPVGTVMSRLSRARQRLEQCVAALRKGAGR